MIYLAFALIGFSALVTQIICIRELLITLTGNELSLGIYLSNWLFASAAGSYALTKIKSDYRLFPYLQIGTALFIPVVLILIRLNRAILHLESGESIDLMIVFIISLFLLFIPGFLSGAQFTAAYRFLTGKEGYRAGARVYLLEALGCIAAGIATTYIMLTTFHNFLNIVFISFLNLCSASYFLLAYRVRWQKLFSILTLSVLLIISVPGVNYLHKYTVSAQWPDYEILDYRNSNYGNITLLQREQQLHLLNNGITLAVAPTPDISQNEMLAHIPLLMHHAPSDIMLIGNGIGGLPAEILKHPIQSLDYAELDPVIIDITRSFLPDNLLSGDNRLLVRRIDGRIFLHNTTKLYDIIYLYLPPPESLEINRFYTREFFELCEKRLKKGGVLVFTLPASESYFKAELSRLHKSILQAAGHYFPEKSIILNTSAMISLSDSITNLVRSVDGVIAEAKKRGIKTLTINYANLSYKLNPARRDWYQAQTDVIENAGENSVFHPIAVFYSLLYWNAQHAPYLNTLFAGLAEVPFYLLLLLPVLIFLSAFFILKKKGGVLSILFPIGITGYTGMASSVMLVIIFQSLYGYIYQWIGLIATAFMLGMSAGTYGVIAIRTNKKFQQLFFYAETAWVLQILIMMIFFGTMELGIIPESIFKIIILVLAATTGALVGAQFPLATGLLATDAGNNRAAGIVYAADLAGGWLGGITISIYLIPVFGIWTTCFFLVFPKLTTAFIFALRKFLKAAI